METTCPVFRPTLEEFSQGFQQYVESVEQDVLGSGHGICKVIPPAGWWTAPDYRALVEDSTGEKMVKSPVTQLIAGKRGNYELTLMVKPSQSLKTFERKAQEAAARRNLDDGAAHTPAELERTFWRSLSSVMTPPMYGADCRGTLFGGAHASGWNVDNLNTTLQQRLQHCPVTGVSNAMLYVGMFGAMFAWHVEDMNLYSINYLHFGAAKSWYAVKPDNAARFESMAQALQPELAAECPEFLRHKCCVFSPARLKEHGIPFDTVVQRAGEFVLTFPKSYHSGFSHGFNIAESTNFLANPVAWALGHGREAGVCRCSPDSVFIDTSMFLESDRLALSAAAAAPPIPGRFEHSPHHAKRRRANPTSLCKDELTLDIETRPTKKHAGSKQRQLFVPAAALSTPPLTCPAASPPPPRKGRPALWTAGAGSGGGPWVIGARVSVKWNDGQSYCGRILRVHPYGPVDVLYDDSSIEERVEANLVRALPSALIKRRS